MKTATHLMIVLVFCLALAITVNAQDDTQEQEEEILLPNLIMLELEEPFAGELDVNNVPHAVLYTFGATEGDIITISMNFITTICC